MVLLSRHESLYICPGLKLYFAHMITGVKGRRDIVGKWSRSRIWRRICSSRKKGLCLTCDFAVPFLTQQERILLSCRRVVILFFLTGGIYVTHTSSFDNNQSDKTHIICFLVFLLFVSLHLSFPSIECEPNERIWFCSLSSPIIRDTIRVSSVEVNHLQTTINVLDRRTVLLTESTATDANIVGCKSASLLEWVEMPWSLVECLRNREKK